jgi:hypothetical protein
MGRMSPLWALVEVPWGDGRDVIEILTFYRRLGTETAGSSTDFGR